MRGVPGRRAVAPLACALSLSLAATGLSVLATGASATSAPAAVATVTTESTTAPSLRKIARTKAKVEALRAKIRRTDAVLTARTVEWERSQEALKRAVDEHARIESQAVAARAEAARAHLDLGRFASAAYRGNSLPTELSLLVALPSQVSDTLHGLQTLEHSGQVKVDIASYAQQSAARAQELTARALELRNANALATYRLDVRRGEMIAAMAQSQERLARQVEALAELEVRRLDAGCLARAKVAQEYPNGMIPIAALCSTGIGGFMLRGDAAVAFKRLAAAYEKDRDEPICVTSAYRTRALQTELFAEDPIMVAAPGRSQHGLGLALDLCGGIEDFDSPQHAWMTSHAADYGWYHPAWAKPDGITPEPWHWQFDPELLAAVTAVAKAERARDGDRAAGP